MFSKVGLIRPAILLMIICVGACASGGGESTSIKTPAAPEMPAGWEVVSDWDVPAQEVEAVSKKLGVKLSCLRNTVYEVNGKQVKLNILVTPDVETADKLMTTMKSIKSEEAFLRKDLIVYEFVGENDVLPEIAEGKKHLAVK